MTNVYAHTEPSGSYPAYVSVNTDDGLQTCRISVRSTGAQIASEITLTADQASELAAQLTKRFGGPGQPYGIVDPDYARIFSIARCLAWAEGYAVSFNGSFTRDLDLIAIPWTEHACDPEHLMRRIEDAAGLKNITQKPGDKPHGRKAWTLVLPGFADPRWVDLSVMPRAGG